MMTKDAVVTQLRKKGLKITPQRLAIIEVLVRMQNLHPSVGAVYREAKVIRKNLSLSTTYATLSELSAHGIIRTLQFDPAENRYEANLEEHVNLICQGCGKILDYKVSSPADRDDIEKNTGFSVRDTRLEYYGYCEKCREETEKDAK